MGHFEDRLTAAYRRRRALREVAALGQEQARQEGTMTGCDAKAPARPMTAKHVTVEGLAEALNTSAWQYHSGAEPLARSLFAALPDDCPAEAQVATMQQYIEKEARKFTLVDRALGTRTVERDRAEADAAALAEALREAICTCTEADGICMRNVALAAHDRRVKGGE